MSAPPWPAARHHDVVSHMNDDEVARAIVAFLQAEGAAKLPHCPARGLLDHLIGTYEIVRRWREPQWLAHAALIHSVYGTDSYQRELLSMSRRHELAAVAGERPERLAYLFSVTPRRPLFTGVHLWARELPLRSSAGGDDCAEPPSREEFDALVLLHMANIADQAQSSDGSPGRWLLRSCALAELLEDGGAVRPPPWVHLLAECSEQDEAAARRAYVEALTEEGDARASRRFPSHACG
jgi:hypothetical protein